MVREKLQQKFFLLLFIGISVLTCFIFLPFLKVIALAAILATLLYPFYTYVLNQIGHKKRRTATFIVMAVVAIIIIVPAILLGTQIFSESRNLYFQIRDSNVDHLQYLTTVIENPLKSIYPGFSFDVQKYVGIGIGWVAGNLNVLLSTTFHTVFNIVLVIVSLFFFLKDGPEFKKTIIKLSPLSNTFDEQIFTKVERTINSVIRGMLLVALVQGILAGVGLTIFGVQNGTLWGAVAAISALVPGLGTFLVVGPSVLYLFFTGKVVSAVGLLIWGIFVVGLVDNFLGPYLYSRGVKIHQLFILFAVLGGLIFFGPVGFILGPIVLTLFLSLVDIYQEFILHTREEDKVEV